MGGRGTHTQDRGSGGTALRANRVRITPVSEIMDILENGISIDAITKAAQLDPRLHRQTAYFKNAD